MNIIQRIVLVGSLSFLILCGLVAFAKADDEPLESFYMQKIVPCGDIVIMDAQLEKQYHERRAMRVLSDKGTELYVYFATDNSNTITIIESDGKAGCVLGAGVVKGFGPNQEPTQPQPEKPKTGKNKT